MGSSLPSLLPILRGLWRQRSFTLTATAILAVGLGLTGYMFSAVNGYLLRPLPFPQADRLVHVEEAQPERGFSSVEVPLPDYLFFREGQRSFAGLGAFYSGTLNLGDEYGVERYDGAFVSANTFDLLGVRPLLGRAFVDGDDAPGAPRVVVLGHELWQQRYGGERGVLGRAVKVNGVPATVVGVMADQFRFPTREQAWTTVTLDPAIARDRGPSLEVFGRLRNGVSLEQARLEMAGLAARLAAARPDTNAGVTTVTKPYADEYLDDGARRTLLTMLGTVVLVLLIACANVANLMLARHAGLRREMAIRTALGASRASLVLQVLVEALVVSLAGAAIGGALADYAGGWTLAALQASETMAPPYWVRFDSDPRTIGFLAVAAFASAALAGLLPGLRSTHGDVHEDLRSGGHGLAGSPLSRLTRSFLAVQFAFACVVLVGAALSARAVVRMQMAPLGVDVTGVLAGRIGLAESEFPTAASRARFYEQLEERAAALPGVLGVTVATGLPATSSGFIWIEAEGQPVDPGRRRPHAARVAVSPTYFATFSLRLLEGRAFSVDDHAGALPVAIVNQKLAARHWPGQSALGRRVRLGEPGDAQPWRTVVGVVPDVRQGRIDREIEPAVYEPFAQAPTRFASIALRTAAEPLSLAEPLRKAVAAISADTPVYWLRTLEAWVDRGRFQGRFFAALFGSFAIGALILGALGQYAVLAYAVGQRTREIGLRRALGAANRELLRMTVSDGLRHLGPALMVGAVLSMGFAQALRNVLYGVQGFEWGMLAAVAATLTAAVVLASLIPARRALRIDPAVALRDE